MKKNGSVWKAVGVVVTIIVSIAGAFIGCKWAMSTKKKNYVSLYSGTGEDGEDNDTTKIKMGFV